MLEHAGALTSREHTLSTHAQEKARNQGQSARKRVQAGGLSRLTSPAPKTPGGWHNMPPKTATYPGLCDHKLPHQHCRGLGRPSRHARSCGQHRGT